MVQCFQTNGLPERQIVWQGKTDCLVPINLKNELLQSNPIHFFNIQIIQYNVVIIFEIEQKTHVMRKCQQWTFTPNVVVPEFDGMCHMVMLGMLQYRGQTLCLARSCFDFQGNAFSLVTNQKIKLKPKFFMVIIQLAFTGLQPQNYTFLTEKIEFLTFLQVSSHQNLI